MVHHELLEHKHLTTMVLTLGLIIDWVGHSELLLMLILVVDMIFTPQGEIIFHYLVVTLVLLLPLSTATSIQLL